jgi:hypothetical protein
MPQKPDDEFVASLIRDGERIVAENRPEWSWPQWSWSWTDYAVEPYRAALSLIQRRGGEKRLGRYASRLHGWPDRVRTEWVGPSVPSRPVPERFTRRLDVYATDPGNLREILEAVDVSGLAELRVCLHGDGWTAGAMRAATKAAEGTSLRGLGVFGRVPPEAARVLARWRGLSEIRLLSMSEGAGPVLASEASRGLEELNTTYDPATLRSLESWGGRPTALRLLSPVAVGIGIGEPSGVSDLARLRTVCPTIRELCVPLPDRASVGEFAALPFRDLDRLTFGQKGYEHEDDDAAEEARRAGAALAAAVEGVPWVSALRELTLNDLPMEAEGYERLARWPFRRIERLRLHCRHDDDGALGPLFSGPRLELLRELILFGGRLNPAVELISQYPWRRLEALSLVNGDASEDLVCRMVGSRSLNGLRRLWLPDLMSAGEPLLGSLASAGFANRLTLLSVPFDCERGGLEAFRRTSFDSLLHLSLSLRNAHAGCPELSALGDMGFVSRLRFLTLFGAYGCLDVFRFLRKADLSGLWNLILVSVDWEEAMTALEANHTAGSLVTIGGPGEFTERAAAIARRSHLVRTAREISGGSLHWKGRLMVGSRRILPALRDFLLRFNRGFPMPLPYL